MSIFLTIKPNLREFSEPLCVAKEQINNLSTISSIFGASSSPHTILHVSSFISAILHWIFHVGKFVPFSGVMPLFSSAIVIHLLQHQTTTDHTTTTRIKQREQFLFASRSLYIYSLRSTRRVHYCKHFHHFHTIYYTTHSSALSARLRMRKFIRLLGVTTCYNMRHFYQSARSAYKN